MSRLKEQYENEIKDAMIKKFGYKNTMEVPKLDKIVVNMGVGEAKENAKLLEAAVKDMEAITGQKAVPNAKNNHISYEHICLFIAISSTVKFNQSISQTCYIIVKNFYNIIRSGIVFEQELGNLLCVAYSFVVLRKLSYTDGFYKICGRVDNLFFVKYSWI